MEQLRRFHRLTSVTDRPLTCGQGAEWYSTRCRRDPPATRHVERFPEPIKLPSSFSRKLHRTVTVSGDVGDRASVPTELGARASSPFLLEQAPLPYTGGRVQVDREALPRSKPHAMFGGRFARDLWRLTCIYWASPAARQGALLLALAIALEFGTVYGNVLIAMTQKHVGDAVQDKQMSEFRRDGEVLRRRARVRLVSTYCLYVRQWLEMHWRQSVTAYYLGR